MHRMMKPSISILTLLLSVGVTHEAWAIVLTSGDIQPANSTFGVPSGVTGVIDDDGNQVFPGLYNPLTMNILDPTSGIWSDYETGQNIIVGENAPGSMSITAGTALRYQHLVLGGVSDLSAIAGGGGSSIVPLLNPSQQFDFTNGIDAAASLTNPRPPSGFGSVTIAGFGSVYNNDPQLLPGEFLNALRDPALGGDPAREAEDGVPTDASPTRIETGRVSDGFDVVVGHFSRGELTVSVGGRVEIQDALAIGVGPTAAGTVNVDGSGSTILASGRSDVMAGMSMATLNPSIIGGLGSGQLSIVDGGTVLMANGATLGFVPGEADDAGIGTVLVEGPGVPGQGTSSVWQVFASEEAIVRETYEASMATGSPPVPNIALAIGGLAEGDEPGVGVLTIRESARVEILSSSLYDTTPEQANVFVGERGRVEAQGGVMSVGNQFSNAGEVALGGGIIETGVPDVSGQTMVNGAFFNGRFVQDPNNPDADDNFQGVLSGFGTLRVGRFENAQGSIIEGGLFTTSDGGQLAGGPLRIVAASDDLSATTPEAAADQSLAAFSNRGTIRGAIDLEVAGNFENGATGDGTLLATLASPPNGGLIESSGQILSEYFFNRRAGRIAVGPGETLSILSSAETGLQRGDTTLLEDLARSPTQPRDGVPDSFNASGVPGITDLAVYYQANLGSVSVNGGSLEFGQLGNTQTQPLDQVPVAELFRNARFFADFSAATVGEVVGNITVTSGQLTFRSGLYNTGVLTFNGGDNVVRGDIINSNPIDYSNPNDATTSFLRAGSINIVGDNTSVTFEDDVLQYGELYIAEGNTATFLGDLDQSEGELRVAINVEDTFDGSSPITVAGDLIFGNTAGADSGLTVQASNGVPGNIDLGFSIVIATATGDLVVNGLPSFANAPVLPSAFGWRLVTDTVADQIRLEVVAAGTPITGDANADGMVDIRDLTLVSDAALRGDVVVPPGSGFDYNFNGVVDFGDLTIAQSQFGRTGFVGGGGITVDGIPGGGLGSPIPEPAAAALATLAVCGFCRRRQQ